MEGGEGGKEGERQYRPDGSYGVNICPDIELGLGLHL